MARLFMEDVDVIEVASDRQAQVGRQRPGSGRPGENRTAVGRAESHRDRRILHLLVVEVGFEVGKDGREADRVGHDLVAFVDQPFVVHLFENPPHALHERDVHGEVRVFHVDPAADTADGPFPFLRVTLDDGAAGGVVLGHPELEDLLARLELERLVDLVLNGHAVAVPAKAPRNRVTAHRPKARHDVFEDTREQMAVMRQAGRERGAVIEAVGFRRRALLKRLVENPVLVPELEDLLLLLGELDVGFDWGERFVLGP